MGETVDIKNQTIDLQKLKPYTLTWGSGKTINCYDHDVEMPVEPPDEDCINYGLPIEDQVFRKTFIPKQVLNPGRDYGDENWSEEQIDHFVDQIYQRRENGVWIFIKGRKFWIPGPYYIFLNFWKLLSREEIIYRYTNLDLWWLWIDTVRDDRFDFLLDFKCRQIGDTEFVIFMFWEYATRVRGALCPMQNCQGEEQIRKAYDRLVYGQKEMIWFLKPINRGTTEPAEGLEFKYPAEAITKGKIREQQELYGTNTDSNLEYEYPEIGSSIMFGPSKERYFDGGTWQRYYMDEFGKAVLMNPIKTINAIRPALRSRILDKQIGKGIGTSTVEELKSGNSLKWAKQMWNQSKIRPDGTSLNRCRRIFRSSLHRAPVDRWGFPKAAEEKKWIEETSRGYLEAGDMEAYRDHKRSNPLTIDDVFESANDQSTFDTDKLAKRQLYLNSEDYKNPKTGTNLKPWVRGNLRWQDDDMKTRIVVWEPNSNGRWLISHHPGEFGFEANARMHTGGLYRPGNLHAFKCGVDPYEQKEVLDQEEASLGGIAVKRKLDPLIDGPEKYYDFTDEARGIQKGDPIDLGAHFQTNRYCCTYVHRWKDPEKFYEDVALTVCYFGCQFLPEKNKANGLLKWMDAPEHNFSMYKCDMPNLTSNYKGQSEKEGVTATDKTKDEYFGYLMTLSSKWTNTIDHPDALEQLLTMNWDNATYKDLGVAMGWCEYHDKLPNFYKPKTIQQKTSVWYHERLV